MAHLARYAALALTTVLVAASVAAAAGFDVNAASERATVASSGSLELASCSDEVELEPVWALDVDDSVDSDDSDDDWDPDDGADFVLDEVAVVGPADIGASCDGSDILIAISIDGEEPLQLGPLAIVAGEALPSFSVAARPSRDSVASISVLMVPRVVVELGLEQR